jgi:hypothetical protein
VTSTQMSLRRGIPFAGQVSVIVYRAAMRSVSYARRSEAWSVRGTERRSGIDGYLLLSTDDLDEVATVDLKAALRSRLDDIGYPPATAHISAQPVPELDDDSLLESVWFEIEGDRLLVAVMCWMTWPEDGNDEAAVAQLRQLVVPLLAVRGAAVADSRLDYDWSGPSGLAAVLRLAVPLRGKSAAALYSVGRDVARLSEAMMSGAPTRETVADLVRGGQAAILVGQPEGNWLDAKAEEYDLTLIRGKISLAQAAARFANAESGGLIVIGVKAKKIPGGEIIQRVSGVVPRQDDTVARYLRVLDQHLYPPIAGIRIDVTETGKDGRILISIDIPEQPEEQKPFLVHGALLPDGSTEGAFISIVRRRGEASIPITAPMIHANLAAGRAFLRNGLPPS